MILNRPYLTLLTAPRSGSHWLSELLAINGLALPAEHLWNVRSLFLKGQETRGYICSVLHQRMTNYSFHLKVNPLLQTFPPLHFSSKLMPEDLQYFDQTGGPDYFEAPQHYEILLWRRDFFSQTLSYTASLLSGSWYTKTATIELPHISRENFLQSYESLLNQYSVLLNYFTKYCPDALVINYEDVKLNPKRALEYIYLHCKAMVPKEFETKVSSDYHGYKFSSELIEELKSAMTSRPDLIKKGEKLEIDFNVVTKVLISL